MIVSINSFTEKQDLKQILIDEIPDVLEGGFYIEVSFCIQNTIEKKLTYRDIKKAIKKKLDSINSLKNDETFKPLKIENP